MNAAAEAAAVKVAGDEATPEFVDRVLDLLARGEIDTIRAECGDLSPVGAASLIEQIDSDSRQQLVGILKRTLDPETLVELDESVREEVFENLDASELAAAAKELDTDDAVELLEELGETERREVLDELPAQDRSEIEQALAYPEESAGRLMQRALVKAPDTWTVGQVIDWCREATDLPDDVYDLFVVDPTGRLVGAVPLGRMLRAKRDVRIIDIVDPDIASVVASADQEEVAHLFRDLNLVSCPVVDSERKLVGVIMVDDVVDVIDEEAEEDLLKMHGVGEVDVYRDVVRTTRSRFSWLLINLGATLIAALAISQFEEALGKIVALAVLMPIVASMGGNAGIQTLTVAVRALAMGELTPANALRFVGKELIVGGLNGVLFALVAGVVAGLWFASWQIGAVIAAAMVINLLAAGVSGALIPIVLSRMKIDPAVSSSVFLTTVTDVLGFVAFLGLASIFLL